MKKKAIVLAGVIMATVAMTACGAKTGTEATTTPVETTTTETTTETTTTETTTTEATTGEGEETGLVGMANPWVEITEDEADELVMRLFTAPDGATVQEWMKCEELGDPDKYISPLVQLSFSMDDMNFTARAQQGAAEDEDITGLYVEWTEGPSEVTLANWGDGNMQAKVYRSVGDTGYVDLITWYDIEIGIQYSLSVAAADLEGFDIQAVAEQMYTEENEPYGNAPDVEEVRETGDGVYAGYLRAGDRELIGTTDENGILYSIVYQTGLFDTDLCIVGAMNYKENKEQDPMLVTDDLIHTFTVDESTVYQMQGGENGAEIVTQEDFVNYLDELKESGLYLEIEVQNGIVKTASINA